MKHDDIRDQLLALRDRELPPEERNQVIMHLSVCEDCRITAARWDKLRTLLAQAAAPAPSEAFIFKVMEKIAERNPEPAAKEGFFQRLFFPAIGYAFAIALLVITLMPRESYAVNVESVLMENLPQETQWAVAQDNPDVNSLWNLKEEL